MRSLALALGGLAVDGYLGIVIEESLADRGAVSDLDVVARKPHGAWGFLLVRVGADRLESAIRALQGAMARDDTWYAHFFRGEELVVVYRDRVFFMRTDPASWTPAVEYGMARGVPVEQLDYHPRTRGDALAFFNVPPM